MKQHGNSLGMKETNRVAIWRIDGFFKKPHASYQKIPVPEDAPTPKTHGPIIEDETIPRLRHRKNDTWGEGAKKIDQCEAKGESFAEKRSPAAAVCRRQEGPEREITRQRDRNTKKIMFRHKFITNRFNSRDGRSVCMVCLEPKLRKGI